MDYDKFLGVNLQEAPHLVREGELSDMRNLRADTKELVARPGIEWLRTMDFGNAFQYLPTAIFDMPIPYRASTDARSAIGHHTVEWGIISSVHALDPDSWTDVPDYEFDNWPDLNRREPLATDTVVVNVSTTQDQTDQHTLFQVTLSAVRGGILHTGFSDGANVELSNTFYNTGDANEVEHSVLTPIDLTTGWVAGVWQQNVVISSMNEYGHLWIGAVYEKNYGTTTRMRVTQ